MICVLLLAAGEGWESPALADLEAHPGVVVLKRCVDVDDLLATVTSGQADVAIVSLDAPGLDPSSIAHLRRHAVRPVAVTTALPEDLDAREHAARLGITALVGAGQLATLPVVVTTVEDVADTLARDDAPDPAHGGADASVASTRVGKVVAVWGPAGAPGRTTVAVNLAWELARREAPVVLADLDPYGGAVAQQLGILDEVSGLLSATRLAATGQLDDRFASVCRGVGHLAVVTGLPRADRWREVRVAQVDQLLDRARAAGEVVVDTGFSLEEDPGSDLGRPGRNALTLAALEQADEVVVVGSADPVGLARLARGLVDLRERTSGAPVRVVVNRMRPSIGWSEKEIAGMVEGFSRVAGLHFLPEDRNGTDRALVSGRPLAELGDSSLVQSIAALGDAVFPAHATDGAGSGRSWRGGRSPVRRPGRRGVRRAP